MSSKEHVVKDRGTLGPGRGNLKQIRLLNRVIRYMEATPTSPEDITWEADARHVELIANQIGLSTSAARTRATVPDKGELEADPPAARKRPRGRLHRLYKSPFVRLAYLSMDRPDVQYASKELCLAVSRPTRAAFELFKRVVRYLLSAARPILAGCPVTLRSTSCVSLMLGRHTLLTSIGTQGTVALSSGEAEFYAAVKAACKLLGLGSLLEDMGQDWGRRLGTDTWAAKGLALRRGAGAVRHIPTPSLWLQDAIGARRLELRKDLGATRLPDLGTKVLSGEDTRRHCKTLGLRFEPGSGSGHFRVQA